jgi:hypothetical protein
MSTWCKIGVGGISVVQNMEQMVSGETAVREGRNEVIGKIK